MLGHPYAAGRCAGHHRSSGCAHGMSSIDAVRAMAPVPVPLGDGIPPTISIYHKRAGAPGHSTVLQTAEDDGTANTRRLTGSNANGRCRQFLDRRNSNNWARLRPVSDADTTPADTTDLPAEGLQAASPRLQRLARRSTFRQPTRPTLCR